jgi:hypothetical protein
VERTTIARETEELGENLPQRHFVPPQIPHEQVRFRTPDRSGGKPATNRLSYGAAFLASLTLHYLYVLYSDPVVCLAHLGIWSDIVNENDATVRLYISNISASRRHNMTVPQTKNKKYFLIVFLI